MLMLCLHFWVASCLVAGLGEALLVRLLLGWWCVSAEQQVTSSVSSGSSNCGLGWLWLFDPRICDSSFWCVQ